VCAEAAKEGGPLYNLDTRAYPSVVTASLYRNSGKTTCDESFWLTDSGFVVKCGGNYYVTFEITAIGTYGFVFLLGKNFLLDPTDLNIIATTNAVQGSSTVKAAGIIRNLAPCTSLSILVTNVGSPQPAPVSISNWRLTALKICDSCPGSEYCESRNGCDWCLRPFTFLTLHHSDECTFGIAGRGGTNSTFLPISVPTLPATTLLSVQRTIGFVEGDVTLTANGLTLNTCGNYHIVFSTTLLNPNQSTLPPPTFVVYLAVNGQILFDTQVTMTVASVQTLFLVCDLCNVSAGDSLTLVIGSTQAPAPATLAAWNIQALLLNNSCPPQDATVFVNLSKHR